MTLSLTPPIRAVLFDLDGTLRHNQPDAHDFFFGRAIELGLDDQPDFHARAFRWAHYYWSSSAELRQDLKDFPVDADGRFWENYATRYLYPGFYVTQSRKERWKLENPLFLRKMEQFRPIFHHFYAKIAMLGRIGKGSNERFAGSDFHPVGERNVAGGSHVKILNP